MKITADTTEAKILAPVTAAKIEMLDYATKQVDGEFLVGEQMVSLAQNVYSAETLATAQIQYLKIVKNAPERRLDFLFEVATRSDDTWSGRKNDSRRSARDAVVAWAQSEAFDLRSEK